MQTNKTINTGGGITDMTTLKQIPCWLPYNKLEQPDGTFKKPPANPKTGKRFSEWNKPGAQVTYTEAMAAVAKYSLSGVGIVVPEGYAAIDIDTLPDERTKAIVGQMDSYTEYSPSGKLHIICKADEAVINSAINRKKAQWESPNGIKLECYLGSDRHFLTVTEQPISEGMTIEERTDALLDFLVSSGADKKEKPKQPPQKIWDSRQGTMMTATPDAIIERINNSKQGAKFRRLFYEGDTSGYNDDESRADLALCGILAFWVQGDESRIDEIFRRSALYRADKWERIDYRQQTITTAIFGCKGKFYSPPGRPPKPGRTTKEIGTGNEVYNFLTIDGLAEHLHSHSISVKYNDITNSLDIIGLEESTKDGHASNSLPIIVADQLKRQNVQKAGVNTVKDYLGIIALRNRYNPVLDMIDAVQWDNVDRLPEVFAILGIADDDDLSKRLAYRWLLQCLSMARNTNTDYQKPFGADGVLVLVGEQGVGKTTFFRTLALNPDFFLEGARVDPDNKDTIIRCTSRWIVELGEIGSTFRANLDMLKAFITSETDNYRRPYGHDDLRLPRKTSFCGTCNDMKYLIDTTGNRRFWTVPVTTVDLEALGKLNVLQLWAQINEKAKRNPQGFRLKPKEQAALAERNSRHEKPVKGLEEILDLIARADAEHLEYRAATISEFKQAHLDLLRNFSVNQIGTALGKAGIPAHPPTKVDGKTVRHRQLPMPIRVSSHY